MIEKALLQKLYVERGRSVQSIAAELGYSRRGVKYWMDKHKIASRSISDAVYLWHNPNGDPFKFRRPKNMKEAELFGLGLGLYWGEGTKADKNVIRLGNTDPALIRKFMDFLTTFFTIDKADLKFGLQIFSDMNPEDVLKFWIKELGVLPVQFHKPTVTISGSIGTYRHKSKYGVLTIHYNNTKARKKLEEIMPA